MKILMISADANIAKIGESARTRIVAYGDLVDRLQVFILAGNYSSKKNILSPKVEVTCLGSVKKVWPFFIGIWKARGIEVDIISCQDPFFTGLLGVFLSYILKAKLEIQVHTDLFSADFINFSTANKIRLFLARLVLVRADGIRVVSERIKTGILNSGVKLKSEPVVLPIFVDLEKFESSNINFDLHQRYPSYKKIILMVSRLSPEKNFPLALNVFAKVVSEYPTCGLVIVGDGSERKNILILASQLGIGDRVVLEGWKNDLLPYYKTADVFLQTSKFEGYGLSLLEALICGLPVVSTPVGIMTKSLGQMGWSVDDLCQSIILALDSPRKKIAIEKILKFKNFSAYAKAIVQTWSKII